MKKLHSLVTFLNKKTSQLFLFAALLICAIFTFSGAFISVHRYWQFETNYYDFGIYDQAIWRVSRFQSPVIDHFILSGKVIFADHFAPTVFLLSPLYWFTGRQEIILVAQAAAVGLSGFVLFLIGKKITHSNIQALSAVLAYFFFTGLQNAIITDFHELTIMTLPLMLTFFAIITKRPKLFWLSFFLTLGCKESLSFLGLGLAWFIWWEYPEKRREALTVAATSIIWGAVTIGLIIPYFSGGAYLYSPKFDHPSDIITGLYSPPMKLKTTALIFASFAGLPLGSIGLLPMIGLNLVTRFLSSGSGKWDLGFHYNAEIAPTLAVASLFTLRKLQQFFDKRMLRVVSAALVLVSFILFRVTLHGPFLLAINPAFAPHSKDFGFLEELVKNVPANESVMAQNNLAVRFTHGQVFLLRDNYWDFCPQNIVIDDHGGQNINNFFGVKNLDQLKKNLQKDPTYAVSYRVGDEYIYHKLDSKDCQPPLDLAGILSQ